MSSNQSNLSSEHYGYDFVVATTQASINSGLKEYLNASNQPETIICFLADINGLPTIQKTLSELKAETGGINPFDIPDGTTDDDPRITTLTNKRFMVGLKIKMGLPPGVLPKDVPSIVDLGASANNVSFNLFCSELVIIQNVPSGGFVNNGRWNVWTQPSGTPWYFKSTVNLLYSDLKAELDTLYFNNHPAQKQALLNKLKNLETGAFSLQQLLFDLDNAELQSIPTIEGMDSGSSAESVLTRSFINIYSKNMKTYGSPVLSVRAVTNSPDESSLRLTGMEREVNQFVDERGVVIQNPTAAQKEVVTLDYLCAANNNHLNVASSFDFNWVDPTDVDNVSGVISINRNTLAKYYQKLLMQHAKQSCLKAWTTVKTDGGGAWNGEFSLTGGQTPLRSEIYPPGSLLVLEIGYGSSSDYSKPWGLLGYMKFNLETSYSCTVKFSGNSITIVQKMIIFCKLQDVTRVAKGTIVDKTITDTITLSIGQNGRIVATSKPAVSNDDSGKIQDEGTFAPIIEKLEKFADKLVSTHFTGIPASDIQDFVFPGANVFAYKNVHFSEHQDLVSDITYVSTS